MNRTFLAALIGGIVMFVWGALTHMVLPLGEMGISAAPAEAEIIETLKSKLPEPGLYFLPDMRDIAPESLPEAGPSALLAWRPTTSYGMGKDLAIEFFSGLIAAWIAALILSCCAAEASLLSKGLLTMGMGLFGWLSISVSHWTWYGFSNLFFLSEGLQQAIGWLLSGLAMGRFVRPRNCAAA